MAAICSSRRRWRNWVSFTRASAGKMRRSAVILLPLLVAGATVFAQKPFPPITANDRIIVVAPHPDDEILGAGGLIQQACAAGAEVHVIYLTSGDHNQIAFKLYRRIRLHLSP